MSPDARAEVASMPKFLADRVERGLAVVEVDIFDILKGGDGKPILGAHWKIVGAHLGPMPAEWVP